MVGKPYIIKPLLTARSTKGHFDLGLIKEKFSRKKSANNITNVQKCNFALGMPKSDRVHRAPPSSTNKIKTLDKNLSHQIHQPSVISTTKI